MLSTRAPGRSVVAVSLFMWVTSVAAQFGDNVVSQLNLFMEQNAAEHYTLPFKNVRGSTPSLVLRRGFAFKISVASPASQLVIIFTQGDNPAYEDGSLVQLGVPPRVGQSSSHPAARGAQWALELSQQRGQMRLLRIHIPVTAGVGRWVLTVAADGQQFQATPPIYVLFNPWHSEDPVFLESEDDRLFYVMQDRGIIFHGQLDQPSGKEWYYGQFEKVTLPTAEFLFKISEMPPLQRGDPIAVSRMLASAVNSKDNNGLVQGRWEPPYVGGVHPFAWSSSSAILNQYMEMGGNAVLYGQCYVFAAVLNTLLRAIGIPSRVVTNFPSVHTNNAAQVLNILFVDERTTPLLDGAIWNFHVWNEGWMLRPDLPNGYGGWQVLDGTPQSMSSESQLFEVGPFPVRGVLEDRIELPYDGGAARAAVKAAYRFFIGDPSQPSGWHLAKVEENEAGKLIVTEAIGTGQMLNITSTYKSALAMWRAGVTELVKLELRHDKTVPVGRPIVITYIIANQQDMPCKARLTLSVNSVSYNNEFPINIANRSHTVTVPPGDETPFQIVIKPDDYIRTLRSECMISVEASATCDKNIAYKRGVVVVKPPDLDIDLGPTGPNGRIDYKVSLRNALAIPLTNCKLSVELPGSTRFLVPVPVGSVAPYGEFTKKGTVFKNSSYTLEINAALTCKELPVVTAHRKL